MNIAIIPAKIGSKRLRKKNIKNFLGKPIIYYSIKKAKQSKLFNRIIVSTDNLTVAKIVKKLGVEVPFYRPKYLSDNKIGLSKVISHALRKLKIKANSKNYICCILATAPLMKVSNLKLLLIAIKPTNQ